MSKCPFHSLKEVENYLGPYKKSVSLKEIKEELCSRERLIQELSQKPNKGIELLKGIFFPNSMSDFKKTQLNYLRGNLLGNWWNLYAVPRISSDGMPIIKIKEEGKILEDRLIDIVFQDNVEGFLEKCNLSLNTDPNSIEGKLMITNDIFKAFKGTTFNFWIKEVLPGLEVEDLSDLTEEELQFRYVVEQYKAFNRRGRLLINDKLHKVNPFAKYVTISPMVDLVEFSSLRIFTPIIKANRIFNKKEISKIIENSYDNLIVGQASRNVRNAFFINDLNTKETDIYILNQNEMRIIENPEVIERNSNIAHLVKEILGNRYSTVINKCPALKIKSQLNGNSMLKDIFSIEMELYNQVYQKFYSTNS